MQAMILLMHPLRHCCDSHGISSSAASDQDVQACPRPLMPNLLELREATHLHSRARSKEENRNGFRSTAAERAVHTEEQAFAAFAVGAVAVHANTSLGSRMR